ncbi:alcohol dehydrogenase catalytic domain-containing protein [Streptomyces hoynatensis]|uniref:Butanediol dehydrogenase n=1 Tax=Streptomyces hoynatensis TaxID=1141874 RepID=A0A3A9YNZ3_9ACTN|nr:alcohol dehydrogenase catalytic domain-containing protein [Streptomyces hoynatensis]RKN37783.1 butanediol dehydrogenase [Streptomyces hoynatensis]
MRAVRWHGRGDVRFETVPDAPEPGPDEIRLAVAWCGLCGSDVLEYRSGPLLVPVERPHPVTGRRAPLALGHEVSGRVADAGARAARAGLTPGTLVVLNALLPCRDCPSCRSGDWHLCPDFGHLGMSADGGLADLITVPAEMAVPAPEGLDAQTAALGEPFAVAWHLLRRAGLPRGRRCLVVGAGSIGLAAALMLRAEGNEVTVTDTAAQRLAVCAALGLDPLPVADGAPAGEYGGADVVLECSGTGPGFDLACRAARPGGTVGLAGLPERPVPFDVAAAAHRELTLVGSMSHQTDADLRPALDFLAGHAEEAATLITGRVELPDAVRDGLDVLAGPDRGRHIKILVRAGGMA